MLGQRFLLRERFESQRARRTNRFPKDLRYGLQAAGKALSRGLVPPALAVVNPRLVELVAGLACDLAHQLARGSSVAFAKRMQRIPLGIVVRQAVHELALLQAAKVVLVRHCGAQFGGLGSYVVGFGEPGVALDDADGPDLSCPIVDILEDGLVNGFEMVEIELALDRRRM